MTNIITGIFITAIIGLLLYLIKKTIELFAHKCKIYLYDNERKRHYWGYVKYDRIRQKYCVFGQTGENINCCIGEVQVHEDGFAWVNCWKNGYSLDEMPCELGYIDTDKNIFDTTSKQIGIIQPDANGITRWYELHLKRRAEVFKVHAPNAPFAQCVETGRFHAKTPTEHSLIGRAAAFILLYQHQGYLKPQAEESTVQIYTWKDTALLAAVVFMGIYGLIHLTLKSSTYVLFPLLGQRLSFLAGMTLLYFLLWAIIREIKIELSLNEKNIGWWLALWGSNVGLHRQNSLIQLFTAISLSLSLFLFEGEASPMLLALLIGVSVNRQAYPKRIWDVQTRFVYLPNTTLTPPADEGETVRQYEWELDSPNRQHLTAKLELHFNETDIQTLRIRNPFRYGNDFYHHVEKMLKENLDTRHLQIINHYIATLSNEYQLTMLESIQFILDFVQEPNIRYAYDEESTSFPEYVRYPDETLYDKTGDCDCKAMLAVYLFHNAGLKTLYLASQTHAAVAVECDPEWFGNWENPYISKGLLLHKGKHYYFCETTGDNFRVGDTSDDLSKFTYIVEI